MKQLGPVAAPVLGLLLGCSEPATPSLPAPALPMPERLSETGLYLTGTAHTVDPRNLSYVPQYPLWTDGASKRRWLRLPEGTHIAATDPDHWRFPVGTRFWKELSFGKRTETRYLELTAEGPRYAAYVWTEDGSDALLAPERGVRGLAVGTAGERHDIPGRADCVVCHAGRREDVLGFNAMQLSDARDTGAVHGEATTEGALALAQLEQRGLIEGLPTAWRTMPPRIAARSAGARAALGYLYGNCGHCHNAEGPLAELGLDLDQPATAAGEERVRASSFGRISRYRPPDAPAALRIAPGQPEQSSVAYRMRTAAAAARMPPLGTRRIDLEGVALIESWITEAPEALAHQGENQP